MELDRECQSARLPSALRLNASFSALTLALTNRSSLQFIIEGLLTVTVGCFAPWFVHDFPTAKPRFLTVRPRSPSLCVCFCLVSP